MQINQYTKEIPRETLNGIQAVHQEVFGELFKEQKLEGKKNLLLLTAVIDGEIAAFKIGYEQEDGVFYSWLGGVLSAFRQQGIAAKLMAVQHSWCKQSGYTRVRTYGRNKNKGMLIVNIKAGFNIESTFIDKKGRHKIVFEKEL